MLNYKSPKPSIPYHQIGKEADKELGADAYFLYVKLIDLQGNEDNSNEALKQKTGFGDRKFIKAKNELIDKGYLDTRQVYGNRYVMYIGKRVVKRYRNSKYKKDNRHELNKNKKDFDINKT